MAVKTEAQLEAAVALLADGGLNDAAEVRALLGDMIDTMFDSSISMDITGLTAETSLDTSADFIAMYDTSAAANKKILPQNVGYLLNGGNTGSFTKIYTKIIEMGDWNMDSTTSINVAHGVTDHKNIRSVTGTIRNDADSTYYPLAMWGVSNTIQAGITSIDSTNINIERGSSTSDFNSTSFDTSSSFNRGWLTIIYED